MTADQLAKAAIKTGRDARSYASDYVQRELALARCAMHLHWCDDPDLLPQAAITTRKAIEIVMNHYADL